MFKLRLSLADNWKPFALYGGLFASLSVLLYWRLNSLLPGYSQSEKQAYDVSSQLGSMLDNPINAPFYVAVRGLEFLGDHSYILTRLAATLFGLVTLSLFFWLMHRWYGARTAIIGTVMFGSSAWFLHAARTGTPDVLMFVLIALVAAGVWLKRTNNPLVLLLCFLLAGISIYTPGMIWFIALVGLWEWRHIDFIFKRHLWAVGIGALIFAAALTPIAWAIYKTPVIAKTWVGLPAQGWPDVLDVLKNILEVPLALFFHTPANPEVWLGTLPILDAFAAAMLLLGGWLYLKHARLARAKLFIPVVAVGWGLVSLGGAVSMSVLLPFIYIIVAVGVSFMIDKWLSVFPRNPLARFVGFTLIGIALLASISFQLRSYFVAWPNNEETHTVFSIRAPTDDKMNE